MRKDEVEFLRKSGLGHYVMGKTRTGKKYVMEDKRVLAALRRYNASITVEG